MQPSESTQPDEQKRVIGLGGSIAIVAGSMLGIGIFLTPRVVADELFTAPLFLAAWLLGGMIAYAGAVAYAELGTMFPKAGGDYVFLREAFGSSVSFASGWLLFVGVFGGSIATMSVAICQYQLPVLLGAFIPDVDLTRTVIFGLSGTSICAIALALTLTAVNVLGTRLATWVQVILTMIPFAILTVGAIVAIAISPHETAVPSVAETASNGNLLAAMVTATLAIYFAYAGWNAVGYVGGEVKDPSRNIPRGLLFGTLMITGLYLVLCASFIVVLGMGGLTTAFEAGTSTANALLGEKASYAITVLIALALLGSLNGTVLAGARIGYAMAGDRALPTAIHVLHARWRTPATALGLQCIFAVVLIISGTFESLLELTSIAMLVMGSLSVIALFRFRVLRPNAERPYRAFGFPVVPGFYLAVSAVVIVVSIVRTVTTLRASIADGGEGSVDALLPLLGLFVFVLTLGIHTFTMRKKGGV